jgi:hypothetical protein
MLKQVNIRERNPNYATNIHSHFDTLSTVVNNGFKDFLNRNYPNLEMGEKLRSKVGSVVIKSIYN